jgi:translation initiation factor 2A
LLKRCSAAKQENDAQHKNLRIFSVSSGEELAAFTQKSQNGWDMQFTISESHAVRLVNQELQVFHPATWAKGVVDKLRLDNMNAIALSPGLNPSVAVFLARGKNVCSTLFAPLLFLTFWAQGSTCIDPRV